jgi:hypothetical protein
MRIASIRVFKVVAGIHAAITFGWSVAALLALYRSGPRASAEDQIFPIPYDLPNDSTRFKVVLPLSIDYMQEVAI